jgi:hypothetical protein
MKPIGGYWARCERHRLPGEECSRDGGRFMDFIREFRNSADIHSSITFDVFDAFRLRNETDDHLIAASRQ